MLNLQQIIVVWSIVAAFDATFMFSPKYKKGVNSFIDTVANDIFEIGKLREHPQYVTHDVDDDLIGRLFQLLSFPKMCLYAFSFSMTAICLAIVPAKDSSAELLLAVRHAFLSMVILYVIVIGFVGLMGEPWITRRKFFSFKSLKEAIVNSTTFVRERSEQASESDEPKRIPYAEKEMIQPAHSYLQAIVINVIICAFCIIRFICIRSGYVTPKEIDPVVWNAAVVISLLIPFLPFIVYTAIIRHRRNVVKEYLLYKRYPNIIRNGWAVRGVNLGKALLYALQSIVALLLACIWFEWLNADLAGISLEFRHYVIFSSVMLMVNIIYFSIENRNRINSKNAYRYQDLWRDLSKDEKLIWSVIRDAITVCVLLQAFNSIEAIALLLPAVILYILMLSVIRWLVDIVLNWLKKIKRVQDFIESVLLPENDGQQKPKAYFKKGDKIVPAVMDDGRYFSSWDSHRTVKQMKVYGYELVIEDDAEETATGKDCGK